MADSVGSGMGGLPPEKLMLRAMVYANQPDGQALKNTLVEIRHYSGMNRDLWIFGIEALAIAEMDKEARSSIDEFLSRFAAQAGAMETLIKRVAITENTEVMRYVMDRIVEWRELSPNLRLPLAAVLIQAGDWEGLSKDFADALQDDDSLGDGLSGWVRAVVEAVHPHGSVDQLDRFLNQGAMNLLFFRTMADDFAKTERWDLVEQVVDAGMRHHPHSARLIRWNEKVALHLATRAEDPRLDDALAATGFNYTADDVPALRLKFQRMVEAQEWHELESESLRIRRQRLVWMSGIEETLEWSEAYAAAAREDFERLRVVAPRVLRRDGEMAAWFTVKAELAVEAGSTQSAIRPLELILEEENFYHLARTILNEIKVVVEPAETIHAAEPDM